MKFSNKDYPILELVEDNSFKTLDIGEAFSDEVIEYLDRSNSKEVWIKNVESFFTEFDFERIKICYFAKTIHEKGNLLKEKLINIYPEIPPSKGLYLLPDKSSVLFKWENEKMETIHFFEHEIIEVSIFLFENGRIGINRIPEPGRDKSGKLQTSKYHSEGTLIGWVTLIYLALYHFAEIEIKVISDTESGIKRVKLEEENEIVSESRLNIEVVDSKWFTKIIRTKPFNVSGHLRLQPYGKGLAKRKLIWIEEFEKHGYTLTPKKEN